VRTGNEDCFVAEPMIFGVADGMGGHQAGEVASAIAASTLRDRLAGGAATPLAVGDRLQVGSTIFEAQ
jgi:protein phosphatase